MAEGEALSNAIRCIQGEALETNSVRVLAAHPPYGRQEQPGLAQLPMQAVIDLCVCPRFDAEQFVGHPVVL